MNRNINAVTLREITASLSGVVVILSVAKDLWVLLAAPIDLQEIRREAV